MELRLGTGYEGPTDCCLTVSGGGRVREFLIESDPWKLVEAVAYRVTNRRLAGTPPAQGVGYVVPGTDDVYYYLNWPILVRPADPEYADALRALDWPRDGSDR